MAVHVRPVGGVGIARPSPVRRTAQVALPRRDSEGRCPNTLGSPQGLSAVLNAQPRRGPSSRAPGGVPLVHDPGGERTLCMSSSLGGVLGEGCPKIRP